MHYYQFNLGDYARDTQHLDEMEDLAYRRMLDLYYLKEGPLPKSVEQISRLIRMRTHSESIANVLQEFFKLEKDGYHNAGADKVLKKIYDKSIKAKMAAEKRWSKNSDLEDANASDEQCERNASGMLPNTQYPIPNTQLNTYVETEISTDEKKAIRNEIPIGELIDIYNDECTSLPKVQTWTTKQKRISQLKARWIESKERQNLDWWREFFRWCNTNESLNGSKFDWIADLEAITNPSKFTRLLEKGSL